MNRPLMRRGVRAVAAALGIMTIVWVGLALTSRSAAARAAETPAFLKPGQCFRLTFSVEGQPAWKILEVVDAGWVRAEVDTGPASAQREPAWLNTAQIVSARATRCSD